MSARNHLRWDLVDRGSDPVPATEDTVDAVRNDFATRGSVMRQAATTLEQLSGSDGWTGEAAEKLAEKADEAKGDLSKAAEKYEDAASALSRYAAAVGRARDATYRAVIDAEDAEERRKANADSLLEGVDDPSDEQRDDDDRRGQRLEAAQGELRDAKRRLEQAVDDLDDEARNCAARINSASAVFKDSTMDNIKGFVAAAVDVLNVIAIVIAVIVIVVLTVATFGGFLAAVAGFVSVMMTIGTIVAGLVFALTLVQAAMGEAGLTDVLFAAAALFGGSIVKAGGKLLAPALARSTALARTATITRVEGSFLNRLAGLGERFTFGGLKTALQDFQAGRVATALSQFDTRLAATSVRNPLAIVSGTAEALSSARQVWMLRGVESLTTSAKFGLGLQAFGATGSAGSSIKDVFEAPDAFSSTVDNVQHLDEVFQWDAAERPTSIVPVGR